MDGEAVRTCSDWGLGRIVVVTRSDDMACEAREWAASVVDPDGEVHAVRGDVAPGDPLGHVLAAIHDVDPDLVVLGVASGHRGHRHTSANWVRTMLHRTDRPTAIIGPGVDLRAIADGPAVAGVGKGPATDAALPWAACFAEQQGLDLALVGTVPNHPALGPDGLLDVLAFYLDRGVLAEWKAEDLIRWADELQAMTEADVDISGRVERGRPGPVLVRAAVDASAVIVGRHAFRRDHVALPKPLRYVLDHAAWPVIVVPPVSTDTTIAATTESMTAAEGTG